MPSCVCSVATRFLFLVPMDLWFLPGGALSVAVERKRVFAPKLYRANEETSRLITSIEDVLSTELGSVSPSSCQRIFGLRTVFFFALFRLFQTEERFMKRLLSRA